MASDHKIGSSNLSGRTNMSKKLKIILIVVVCLLAGYFLILRMEEDTWICDHGEWVKHGAPAKAKPAGQCHWTDSLNPFK